MNPDASSVIVTYQALKSAVAKAVDKNPAALIEAAQTPPPGGYESDETPPSAEDVVDLMSELDSALKTLEAEEKVPGVLTSPDERFVSLLQSYVAEASLRKGNVEAGDGGGYEAKFDGHDILGWAGSLLTWVKKLRPHKWQSAPSTPDSIPNSLRAAVLGDWGSGLYGAPACAASIKNDAKDYGLLLHLGDVYYSGTETEVTSRFLNLWPNKPNAVSRACNSNHEMYTGGYAYFDLTLKKFKQPASYFALQNDHWLLAGLDTAYQEWEFANAQVDWLNNLIANAGGRRVILFSHHQLFSWADKTKGKMTSQLGGLLMNKKIFAWYWGHEHRCMFFNRHPVWGIFGRCAGHSGYPYFADTFKQGEVVKRGPQETAWRKVEARHVVPGGLLLEGSNVYIPGHEKEYGPNGYLTLEFDGERLNELAHTPDGEIAYEREVTS